MELFMKILWPTLILVVMAILFAFMLSVLGKKLAVKRDEKIDLVVKKLSGANCGGCGFAGCDAFATALVEGKANLSSCAATSKENKDLIAEILGVSNDGEETKVMVACNGGSVCKDKYTYQGYPDCASASLVAGGSKECSSACLGLGTCEKLCPTNAIEVNEQNVAKVNQEKCIGCGVCITNCPKSVIVRIPASAKVFVACSNHDKGKAVKDMCKNGCIACGLCAKNCEAGAITMVNNLPVIDYSKCTACYKCVEKCPVKCIHKI